MKVVMGCLVWILMESYAITALCAQERLKKIEIYALNIATRYEQFLTIQAVLSHPRRFSDTVRDAEFLTAIEQRLVMLAERDTVTPIGGPHVVCFVHWSGSSLDTLLFGRQQVWYNGNWRDQDPVLLWLLSVRFPQEYQQGVVEEIIVCERRRRLQKPNDDE